MLCRCAGKLSSQGVTEDYSLDSLLSVSSVTDSLSSLTGCQGSVVLPSISAVVVAALPAAAATVGTGDIPGVPSGCGSRKSCNHPLGKSGFSQFSQAWVAAPRSSIIRKAALPDALHSMSSTGHCNWVNHYGPRCSPSPPPTSTTTVLQKSSFLKEVLFCGDFTILVVLQIVWMAKHSLSVMLQWH